MAELAARIEEIRRRARELPSDSGQRVEALDLASDAAHLLDHAQQRLDRAQMALDRTYDETERLVGGWEVVEG